MKKILVTGAGSYIGTSFERYLKENYEQEYIVDTVDTETTDWRNVSFGGYDAVFHVAGIAHSDNGRITEEQKNKYRSVNTNLAIEAAKKAKNDGARQFIFMSSVIVYGDGAPIGKRKLITEQTLPAPSNFYGESKLLAEQGMIPLQDDDFNVVILRPPMVYGKGCRGNYPTLSSLALKLPVFPMVENCRSMLYVENLCEFVRLMIENGEQGIFFPQNSEYSNTSELVCAIAHAHGKKMRRTKIFNAGLYVLRCFTAAVDKAFGSLAYDMSMSVYPKGDYRKFSLKDSIDKTES